MNDLITQLTEKFKEFPGIGERQAKRFVYFLLHKNPTFSKSLSDEILKLKNEIKQCKSCYVFFPSLNNNLCEVCSNKNTDKSLLLIVEKDADYESIRKSKIYHGLYFVLGGLIPIVTKETPKFVRLNELIKNVENKIKENTLKEIVIALSINPQGEYTDTYLREILAPHIEKTKVKISSLGRGLSTGTELEYSDNETIKNALENRK